MYNNMYGGMAPNFNGQMNNTVKAPKPTKSNVENFIGMNLGVDINYVTFSSLSERPKQWKHSCVKTGVVILNELSLNFYGVATIYFAVCACCNKIIYYIEE